MPYCIKTNVFLHIRVVYKAVIINQNSIQISLKLVPFRKILYKKVKHICINFYEISMKKKKIKIAYSKTQDNLDQFSFCCFNSEIKNYWNFVLNNQKENLTI